MKLVFVYLLSVAPLECKLFGTRVLSALFILGFLAMWSGAWYSVVCPETHCISGVSELCDHLPCNHPNAASKGCS